MRPKPWSKRWERPKFNIQGIHFDSCMTPKQMEFVQKFAQPWLEYDMLKEYDTSKLEEQILTEVQQEMSKWGRPSENCRSTVNSDFSSSERRRENGVCMDVNGIFVNPFF